MKVLVACEFSGVVRSAFRARGHDAWSCDLLPAEDGSPFHYQCDFRDIINLHWDFVGYHVDCRVMANSGVRWLYKDEWATERDRARELYVRRVRNEERWNDLKTAASLFNAVLRDPRPGYVENSVMHCHAKALIDRKQDQTIQPWWFGEPKFKATCLWLRGGLKPIVPTNKLTPPRKGTLEHKAWSSVHRASPGPLRWKERSRTFRGIAKAMADQWG